jgi:hypothetical protein
MAPKSTLCGSPHFSPARVESAPDFDPMWRNILTQIHRTREAVSAQQLTIEDVTEASKNAARDLMEAFSRFAQGGPQAPN